MWPRCSQLVDELCENDVAGPFLAPVPLDSVPGYTDVVKTPMDLGTVKERLQLQHYAKTQKQGGVEKALDSFAADMRLIWKNCMLFNEEQSELYAWARKLESVFERRFNEHVHVPRAAAIARARSGDAASTRQRRPTSGPNGDATELQPPCRPASAFLHYFHEHRETVQSANAEISMVEVAKRLAQSWGALSARDKTQWEAHARGAMR